MKGFTELLKIYDSKSTGIESNEENLRRMLITIVEDVRVVFIALASQLNLLRSLKSVPKNIQKVQATLTREIYASLANRLGVSQLKWELEDFSFHYLFPDSYQSIATNLEEK